MSQPRRSRDEWRQHAEAWSRSGLSCREYARRNKLNPNTFSWWMSELRRERPPRQTLTLVPVTTPPARREPLELVLPHAVLLRVPDDADPHRVAEIVRALVAAC